MLALVYCVEKEEKKLYEAVCGNNILKTPRKIMNM